MKDDLKRLITDGTAERELAAMKDQLHQDVQREFLRYLQRCRSEVAEKDLKETLSDHIKKIAEVILASGAYQKRPPQQES